jgi:hypothetical protein
MSQRCPAWLLLRQLTPVLHEDLPPLWGRILEGAGSNFRNDDCTLSFTIGILTTITLFIIVSFIMSSWIA